MMRWWCSVIVMSFSIIWSTPSAQAFQSTSWHFGAFKIVSKTEQNTVAILPLSSSSSSAITNDAVASDESTAAPASLSAPKQKKTSVSSQKKERFVDSSNILRTAHRQPRLSSLSVPRQQSSLLISLSSSRRRKINNDDDSPRRQDFSEDQAVAVDGDEDERYWELGPTQAHPYARPLATELRQAVQTNTHPVKNTGGDVEDEQWSNGDGTFVTRDWRRAMYSYGVTNEKREHEQEQEHGEQLLCLDLNENENNSNSMIVDVDTGHAEYVMEVEGELPDDLHGVLYRNSPGQFGWNGHRVAHVLDASALLLKIAIPPPPPPAPLDDDADAAEDKRQVTFLSRFVETPQFVEERDADPYLYRRTFGTGPGGGGTAGTRTRGAPNLSRGPGINQDNPDFHHDAGSTIRSTTMNMSMGGSDDDEAEAVSYSISQHANPVGLSTSSPPSPASAPCPFTQMKHNAFRLQINNMANTQVVAFGGKLLALFEAGLPHRIDPVTLQSMGTDDLLSSKRVVVSSVKNDKGDKHSSPLSSSSTPCEKLAVTLDGVASKYLPAFLGGRAHTAHPKLCPRTGHMVGWHWQQVANTNAMRIAFTEWSSASTSSSNQEEMSQTEMSVVGTSTYDIPNCAVAPHDMAITEHYIVLLVNALTVDKAGMGFVTGLSSPAGVLQMHGREPVKAFVFPRPGVKAPHPTRTTLQNGSKTKFPIVIRDIPACFSIHISHAYEEETTQESSESAPDTNTSTYNTEPDAPNNNIVLYFTGWPSSDSNEYLGAWGGFAPVFDQVPPTYLWRLKLGLDEKDGKSHSRGNTCSTGSVRDFGIAPACDNICAEHPVVHPHFVTRRPKYTYAVASNVVGDSSPPCGYVRLPTDDEDENDADDGNVSSSTPLKPGERNDHVDSYFFGPRYFAGEPLVVPKHKRVAAAKDAYGADEEDLEDETRAYLLGMVYDAATHKSFVAVFDMEHPLGLQQGPVCKLWCQTAVPHGLHGCFVPTEHVNATSSSYFC
jgi:all-trans-8'-apo-beta-carotenal 15,15'-oxygenase